MLASNYIPVGMKVTLQSENGVLGLVRDSLRSYCITFMACAHIVGAKHFDRRPSSVASFLPSVQISKHFAWHILIYCTKEDSWKGSLKLALLILTQKGSSLGMRLGLGMRLVY